MNTQKTTSEPLPASFLFASLREAKTAGYTVRCVPAGPRDMPHSGVFIYGLGGLHEYLVSRDCTWGVKEARAAALSCINQHQANAVLPKMPPPPGPHLLLRAAPLSELKAIPEPANLTLT